ncbi:MAG: hypothetical protein QOD94_1506 [Alphaproteobacteria bacterium]|jgi:hypothetical protein|nr:hypothetical protein [Alphaproteobacteria bacterium]
MFFSLDVRRARKGDCLLLHYGSKDKPGLVMIDGGPKGVYGPHLKPRLEDIKKKRVKGNEPLQVDLLMVSHVDDDHIQGILELTKELREAMDEKSPQLVQILSLWHNSFDNIIDGKGDELTASVKSQFGAASVSGSGELSEEKKGEVEEESSEEPEVVSSSLKVLASIAQGAQLRVDADKLELPLNEEFGGKLIIAEEDAEAVDMGLGLTFKVVGPMLPEIEALRKKHNEWLKKLKAEGKKPSEVLAAYVDQSVPNLSSLVLLAEVDGKTMLLTGDARGDKILEGLEQTGLIEKDGKLHVDLLKVPHHGSANNLANDFFERIIAKHYVFSGDGEHGNPERESLEMLLKARGDDGDFTIHLTYPIAEIDVERKKDWEKEQTKEKNRKKKNPKTKKLVRDDWSPEENSLTALFADNPKFGKKVRIVDAKKPHLIDLLEPVGF